MPQGVEVKKVGRDDFHGAIFLWNACSHALKAL
jgi:hypothetical protein